VFSKEWFFYVFGRWLVMSGIAGALVQFVLADRLGIHTIPAFLLNQFLLACVFWYVDKLIFKRHFKETISRFFRFPRIRTAYNVREQFDKLDQEYDQLSVKIRGNEDRPREWLNEFIDLEHSVEMMERLLREKRIDVDGEYERVRKENIKKGIYIAEGKIPPKKAGRKEGGFLKAVSGSTILADGAMGTYLKAKGVAASGCCESLNLTNPAIIREVHKEYIDAGSAMIETNTFAANRYMLERCGLRQKVKEINMAGVRIARAAAAGKAFVAGSVGNLGRAISPYGDLSLADTHSAYREQIEALAEGGVDLIMLETMTSFLEAKEAVLVAKEATDIPVVCQVTFTDEGETRYGDKLIESFEELRNLGADIVGINCSLGPRKMLELLEQLPKAFDGMISVQPNAGSPRYKDGSSEQAVSPEYFKWYAKRYKALGDNRRLLRHDAYLYKGDEEGIIK
jgi:methionine synthase I (cobalamin-dependent)